MDPTEFRLKNMPKAGDKIVGVPKLRDVSLGETIKSPKEKIGWGKVKLEKNQGIGIATGSWIESAGPGGGSIVKVNEDGSVTVHIGKIDMGTIPGFGIPMIVAEELGIPVSDVTVVNVDTDASPGTQARSAAAASWFPARDAARSHRRTQSDFQNGRAQTGSEPRGSRDRRQADPRQRHAGEGGRARRRRHRRAQRHRRSHRPRLLRQSGIDG